MISNDFLSIKYISDLGRYQCWIILAFLNENKGISHLKNTNRIWIFDVFLMKFIPFSLYTMQEPSYLGKVALLSIWFGMVLTQIVTQVYKFSHLATTIRYRYLNKFTNLIPTCRSFIPILVSITNTMHLLIYIRRYLLYRGQRDGGGEAIAPPFWKGWGTALKWCVIHGCKQSEWHGSILV